MAKCGMTFIIVIIQVITLLANYEEDSIDSNCFNNQSRFETCAIYPRKPYNETSRFNLNLVFKPL